MKCILIGVALIGFVPAAIAAPADTTQEGSGRLVRPRFTVAGVTYLPKVSYASERGVGIGGTILKPFDWPSKDDDGASTLELKGRVTTKGQSELWGTVELAGSSPFSLRARAEVSTLAEKFYGIGADTPADADEVYRPQYSRYYIELFRQVTRALRVGVRSEYARHLLLSTQADGALGSGVVRGATDDAIVGSGVVMAFDTRNRRYSPRRGVYFQAAGMYFDNNSTSFEFTQFFYDLRTYTPLGSRVLAGQVFVYATDNQVPFWRLAQLGGRHHSRGYRSGRYRDKVLAAAQLELRSPVVGRLGCAFFAGVANVAPTFGEMRRDHIRPTAGFGLRWLVGRAKGLNARIDAAVGENSFELDVGIGQAF